MHSALQNHHLKAHHRTGGVTQTVRAQPSKHEALSSNPTAAKKKKKKGNAFWYQQN
jgi:hypothetical protein